MRSVWVYVLLVGAPLVVLLGILEAGEKLVAPPSIGGGWRIEEPLMGDVARCLGGGVQLEIAQSGVRARVELGQAGAIAVELRGDSIRGVGRPSAIDRCPGGRVLVAARLTGPPSMPGVMTGTIALPECAACAPSPFRATRLPRAER
jgi:hypothetical protein